MKRAMMEVKKVGTKTGGMYGTISTYINAKRKATDGAKKNTIDH